MNIEKMLLFSVSLFGMVFFAGGVFAESLNNGTYHGDNEWNVQEKATDVDCFDYYKFQSVQVSVNVNKDVYKENDQEVKFVGNLVNENDQPVVNGNVFVRISYKGKKIDGDISDWNVVDEFVALDNIALQSKETKKISFSWKMPKNLVSGNYKADFFFSVGKKFNLGGLPFTNEIIIGKSLFEINSKYDAGIVFNREETKVNGEKYYHVGNWPVAKKDAEVTITQPIKNTAEGSRNVSVSYDLYYWDSLDENDKISSKTENVNIPANSEKILEYKIPKMDRSVYYLKITASTDNGQKAIVNIRVVSDQNSPRLNYPAITKFPIKKGDREILYTCFHNASPSVVNGKVEVVLTDRSNKEIARIDYNGVIPSAMSAEKTEFVAKKDYDYIKLSAIVYDDKGDVADKYETVYDCKMFGDCNTSMKNGVQNNEVVGNSRVKSIGTMIALAVILPLIVIIVVIIVAKDKKKNNG